MKKIIKIIGNSLGIIFNKEEQETNKLKAGDHVELTIDKLKDNGDGK